MIVNLSYSFTLRGDSDDTAEGKNSSNDPHDDCDGFKLICDGDTCLSCLLYLPTCPLLSIWLVERMAGG